MLPSDIDTPPKVAPLTKLGIAAGILGLALTVASIQTLGTAWASVGAYLGMSAIVLRGVALTYPHAVLGLCNLVTLFRATLVCFLFGAVFDQSASVWLVLGVAVFAYALDVADGWLARRAGLVSDFGARFDMEIDAALAAAISLWLLASGTVGWEILALGFTRYVFVLASCALPALRGALPYRLRRKVVCAIQIGALILLLCPLTPSIVVLPLTIAASLLLLWSFAIDIIWLLRHGTPRDSPVTPGRRSGETANLHVWHHAPRLGAATLILALVLVQPNHPAGVSWGAMSRFALELPFIVLVLLAFGKTALALPLRLVVTGALLSLSLLKAGDFAMFTALNRAMNPVGDPALVEAGIRLLSGAIGPVWSVAALLGAGVIYAVLAFAIWWASGVLTRVAPDRAWPRSGMGLAACLAGGLVVMDAGTRLKLWTPLFDPPGTTRSTTLAVGKLKLAQATLRDLRAFEAAAANDALAGATGLLDLIDRDVIVIFLESYGRASLDTPLYADLHRTTLATGQAELESRGLTTASGVLSSPTRGGQSWLAHATFANGLWINSDTRYRAVLASGRKTLFHFAEDAGFHTAAVMPQITMDWPESSVMGFETILANADLGYKGETFNWVTMPDQFTFHALERLLRRPKRDRPVFVQVATGSSHAPWVPVPEVVDWESIGDGRIFNEMTRQGDTPKQVWQDRDRVRAQYRLAMDYALQTVLSY
ncbi:MAG: CDP-alcohol phosphatidyltransferase family protein, partial [Pseudomonadota bacterium]